VIGPRGERPLDGVEEVQRVDRAGDHGREEAARLDLFARHPHHRRRAGRQALAQPERELLGAHGGVTVVRHDHVEVVAHEERERVARARGEQRRMTSCSEETEQTLHGLRLLIDDEYGVTHVAS